MNKLVALLMVVAACKGGDKAKSGDHADKGSTKGGCETKAAKPADMITGKTPQIISPLDKLSLGMSRADVEKACPNFFADESDKKKTGTYSTSEIIGKFGEVYAQARLEFVADKLDSVAFSLPPEIADGLTAAWGAPKASTGDKPARAWFDEASGMRAILSPPEYDGRLELEISKYVPLAAFLDPESKAIAWKPQDVLGKQPADLAKTFAQYLKVEKTSAAVKAKTDEMMADMKKEVEAMGIDTTRNANLPEFELPAAPYNDGGNTHVILYTNDDSSVRSYGVWFHTGSITPEYGFPVQGEEIVKKLDELYGAHKVVKETLGDQHVWYDAKRGVRATTRLDKPADVDLTYVRYLPLANLFGAPGAVWGFEKAERPLIGATPDEIVATYGKDYEVKRDDKAQTITMIMPPTDYDGDTSTTRVLMFVRGGKVGEWHMSIPFDNYEPAKAEYEAALLAKFGAPKPAAHDHLIYAKKVDVEYSKYTHELDIEVSK
ncbi:MAG: hypothetical protein HOV81_28345 [Kofleriaceae bacterium]|nr:hypothetical protein [Kofleriaceae bacterium]